MLPLAALAQTVPLPTITCPSTSGNTAYQFFASSGIGYDQFAKLPSVSTGVGVKTGQCSNAFLVTTITTGLGANNPNPGYGMLSERFEYHLMHSDYFELIGDGQLGVIQQSVAGGTGGSTVTTAVFGGGAAVGIDVGWFFSKKAFHLPFVFHADYVTAPALPNAVKPSYLIDIRKTF